MNQFTRGSREKVSRPDFVTWLLTVKPFESLKSLTQFVGYVVIGFSTLLFGMFFGLTYRTITINPVNPLDPTEVTLGSPVLSWFMVVVFIYCTVDYYLEYKKISVKIDDVLCVCVYSPSLHSVCVLVCVCVW